MHTTVNRWLTSVALVLGILLMAAVLYYGLKVHNALADWGSPPWPAGPSECFDPGGGTVCAPGGPDGLPGE